MCSRRGWGENYPKQNFGSQTTLFLGFNIDHKTKSHIQQHITLYLNASYSISIMHFAHNIRESEESIFCSKIWLKRKIDQNIPKNKCKIWSILELAEHTNLHGERLFLPKQTIWWGISYLCLSPWTCSVACYQSIPGLNWQELLLRSCHNTVTQQKHIVKDQTERKWMRVAKVIPDLVISRWNHIFFDAVFHNSWFTKDLKYRKANHSC